MVKGGLELSRRGLLSLLSFNLASNLISCVLRVRYGLLGRFDCFTCDAPLESVDSCTHIENALGRDSVNYMDHNTHIENILRRDLVNFPAS